jgi:hypothetical protein
LEITFPTCYYNNPHVGAGSLAGDASSCHSYGENKPSTNMHKTFFLLLVALVFKKENPKTKPKTIPCQN